MRNEHKDKNYIKIPMSESERSAHIVPQNHGSAIEGRCKCGKPSAMVWIRQLGFGRENKYWCEQCFAKEKAKEGKKKQK